MKKRRKDFASRLSHLDEMKRGMLFNIVSPNVPDDDTAKLKLALLKENFNYQKFYDTFRKDPYSFLSIDPRPEHASSNRPTSAMPRFIRSTVGNDFQHYCGAFGLNPRSEIILWLIGWPLDDFVKLFDPDCEDPQVQSLDLENALPFFFDAAGIRSLLPAYDHQLTYQKDGASNSPPLHPYEHILLVDMRKRDTQLKAEFQKYLSSQRKIHAGGNRKGFTYKSDETYREWTPENDREKRAVWKQLEVWKLRKRSIGFKQISRQMGLTEDHTKKLFYRAFALIMGDSYRKEFWKQIEDDHNTKAFLAEMTQNEKIRTDKNAWKKYLDKLEAPRKEMTISNPQYSSDLPDEKVPENMLVLDLINICRACNDTECQKEALQALRDQDWGSWNACPNIYKYLKQG